MIPISKAFKIIDQETSRLGSEAIRLERAVGRILAQDIVADTDMPPFDRSQMDGFAVRAEDTSPAPVDLRLVGESAAGRGWHKTLKKGEAVRIMTGAPVPAGADAVQKLELAQETEVSGVFRDSDAPEIRRVSGVSPVSYVSPDLVRILETVEKGKSIVKKGSEIKKGEVLFKTGAVITEGMITGIAAFGYSVVKTAQKPTVAIMSTGSEIVPIDKTPGQDQIRNSNSLMLKVLCERARASTKQLPIAGDDLDKLKSRISKEEKGGKTNILVITGGVSVGKYDLTKAALKELGAEIFFERVRLKPGKPAVFAKLGDMLVFGLPGNPVSSTVTFYLFVRKALLLMQGALQIDLRPGFAVLTKSGKGAKERDSYLPASLTTGSGGQLFAEPLKWSGSSDFVGFARAEALIIVPAGKTFDEGDVAEIVFLP